MSSDGAVALAPKQSVGIVGLGLVGSALASRLQAAGWQPIGYDTSFEACERFRARGGSVAASLIELAAAPVVVLAVYQTSDVLTVVEGEHGLLAGAQSANAVDPARARSGIHTLIDCSTGDPVLLAALAVRLAGIGSGIDFVEAPLSGSSQQIEAGDATMLLGGTAEAIARCDALLHALATRRIHVGPAGFGARAKLATNLVLGLNRAVLAEGMVFAEHLGIDALTFLQLVMATPADSAAARSKGHAMATGDFSSPSARLRQHLKDVELMLQTAAVSTLALPFSATHADLLRRAVMHGDGELDNAAVIRELRRPCDEFRRFTTPTNVS